MSTAARARRARTPEEEADHLLGLYDSDAGRIMDVLHGQLTNLAGRAQTLLQLAGLTITVTGFSGASIARSGRVAAMRSTSAAWACSSSATSRTEPRTRCGRERSGPLESRACRSYAPLSS